MSSARAPPFFIASFIAASGVGSTLSGIVYTLIVHYFSTASKEDPALLKALIVVTGALDLSQTAVLYSSVAPVLAGHPIPASGPSVWLPSVFIILNAATAVLSQTFFALRCSRCIVRPQRAAWVRWCLILVIISAFAFAFAASLSFRQLSYFSVLLPAYSGVSVVIDLFMTMFLLTFLKKHHSNAVESASVIAMLHLTANVALLPLIAQILTSSLYLAGPEHFWYFPFAASQGKVYAIAMLMTICARPHLQEELESNRRAAAIETITGRDLIPRSSFTDRVKRPAALRPDCTLASETAGRTEGVAREPLESV